MRGGSRKKGWNLANYQGSLDKGGPYLVILFTEESKLLSSFMHEHSIKLSILNSSDLYGLAAPTHHVRVTNQSYTAHKKRNRRRLANMYAYGAHVNFYVIFTGLPMDEGISPHCSRVSLMGPPVEFT